MKKILLTFAILLPAVAVAEPMQLTRTRANLYTATDGSIVQTDGCTQTAHAMSARIESHRGHRFVVFYDQSGEEEGDCLVRVTVRKERTLVASR